MLLLWLNLQTSGTPATPHNGVGLQYTLIDNILEYTII